MKIEKSFEEILKECRQKDSDRLRSEVRSYDTRKLAKGEKLKDEN